MLIKFELGSEHVPNTHGGRRPHIEIFDPTRIVAIEARTLGKTDSFILFEGGHKMLIEMAPEKVFQEIQRQTTEALMP